MDEEATIAAVKGVQTPAGPMVALEERAGVKAHDALPLQRKAHPLQEGRLANP
jgi:hypothetical protein